jgi:hypothetical protein
MNAEAMAATPFDKRHLSKVQNACQVQVLSEALSAGVTKPSEIASWVKDKYGAQVKKSLINNVKKQSNGAGKASKANAKTRKASAPAPVGEGRSRSELIREVLTSGIETPAEVALWVKANYGVEVKSSLVGMVKHQWKKAAMRRVPRTRKPVGPTVAQPEPLQAPAALDIDGIVAVKGLVERLGKDTLSKLVDVL